MLPRFMVCRAQMGGGYKNKPHEGSLRKHKAWGSFETLAFSLVPLTLATISAFLPHAFERRKGMVIFLSTNRLTSLSGNPRLF